MRLFVITSVAILFYLSTGHAGAAPVQWEISAGGNGHFYEGFAFPPASSTTSEISWVTANASATAMGGYLATITSQAENDFVFQLISDPYYWNVGRGPYLGGFQPPEVPEPPYDQGWQWVTGEPWGYTNWDPRGEPNNINGPDEDYLHFQGGDSPVDTWNDIQGTITGEVPFAFVVEWNTNPVPEPSNLILCSLLASLAIPFALWRRRRAA